MEGYDFDPTVLGNIYALSWLTHGLIVFYLLGFILIVQFLTYPQMAFVREDLFVTYHEKHTKKITTIVAVPMILELSTSTILFLIEMNGWNSLYLSGAILLFLITFFRAIPLHNKLSKGFNALVIKQLNQANWLRTILWFALAAAVFYQGSIKYLP